MGRSIRRALAALALAALPSAAAAQSDDGGRAHRGLVYVDVNAALEATIDGIHGIMQRLEPDYGPDMNFVLGVVPLQQGVINMAVVVLESGSDPEVAALAEEILATQKAQMARVQALAAAFTQLEIE